MISLRLNLGFIRTFDFCALMSSYHAVTLRQSVNNLVRRV